MPHGRRPRPGELLAIALLIAGALLLLAGPLPTAAAASADALRRSVESAQIDDGQRALAVAQLDEAVANEREADALTQRLARLRADTAAQPARLTQLRRALDVDREQAVQQWAARLPADADAETLERLLDQERATVLTLGAEIDTVTAELAQVLSRPAQTGSDAALLRRRIEELSAPIVALPDEPAVLLEARRLAQSAELRRVRAELALLEAEQQFSAQRQRLDELSLRELRHRQGLHQRRIEILQNRITELGQREIEKLTAGLADMEATLAGTPGPAAAAAALNRRIGDELIAQNAELARDRRALADAEEGRQRVAVALSDSQARLDIGGASEAVGRWLWSERRRLEAPARLRQRLDTLRGTLAELRLRLVVLSEEQRALLDIPAAARELAEAERARSDDDGIATAASHTLEPLLRQRVALLAALEPLAQRRITALEATERVLQQQLDDTQQLRQLLDRHLLWTPSHRPIDGDWLGRVPEGLRDLVKLSRLKMTLDLSLRELSARPVRWVASLVVVVALVLLRRRARARVEAEATVARQLGPESMPATLRALGWTLLAASPAPVALWLLGNLLQSAGSPGRYSDSLGRACIMLVLPLFTVQLLRWSVIERGLAHAHFRWPRPRREAFRSALPRVAAVVLPMYFIAMLAFIRNLDLPNDVQARIAIVIACIALAATAWRLLAAGRAWVVRGGAVEPSTLRRLLRLALPAAMLFIGLLALVGYVYSAGLLMQAVIMTFTMLLTVGLATGLLGRWFLLGERRLLLRQREDERRGGTASPEGDTPAEPEREMTLEQINAQTGRLLRALRLTLVAIGLLLVWAQVLPAAARLEEIAVWSISDTGPDGATVQQPVTLMAVILGVIALTLTSVGARNLPGLIEIGFLSRTGIDAASRYAITSILRYAIVIAGTIIGLGLLGLRWSQLQWMAAALTVGLGFGLQEIFANFVSGLILLFERPFRVGDVITVGEFSGRVTRIRTRATTILDFENKEIVIPNKNFITGQLINWTLSDSTTRVTIKVGVAYGTNPQRVHELLLQVASDNPLVMKEPEPRSLFVAFGASSLDFELRVFVATVADRLPAQNQLNMGVAEAFREHGIEIAFPQLDVHVRDLPRST